MCVPFFVREAYGRDSRDRVKLVPVDDCLSRKFAVSGGLFSHVDWDRNHFLSLLRTGGALLFSVGTDPASKAFVVCVFGSQDRSVPFGPGCVCICITMEKPSSRHFKVPTGHVSPPVFEAFQSPYGARKPSRCPSRGISKTLRDT